MFKKLLPRTIRGKIIASTAAVTILIAAATLSICYLVFQSFLRTARYQSAGHSLSTVALNVEKDMESIFNFVSWCRSNQEIALYLEKFEGKGQMPSIRSDTSHMRDMALNAYDRLKEEYYSTHATTYLDRVMISTLNGPNYLQIARPTTISTAAYIRRLPYFDDLLEAPDYTWVGLADDGQRQIFPIVRPVYRAYDATPAGWCYVAVSSRVVSDYLKNLSLGKDSALYLTVGNQNYSYDEEGKFESLSSPPSVVKTLENDSLPPEASACLVRMADGSLRTMVTLPLGVEGWSLSMVLSELDLMSQRQVYLAIIAGIALIILALGGGLGCFLNRAINPPVKRLTGKIRAVSEGDFSRDPSIEREDELGEIGRGINQMSEELSALIKRRIEDERQKKDLEYQILQSQINPHFLYNTLNSIKWMATLQNAPGIAEMTMALARLMKNVSKGTASQIPLKEELGLVQDYFVIQQYRYGGSISIQYDVNPPKLEQALIHRFTLQPIVENALFHGIEPSGRAGKILISARQETDSRGSILVIRVRDNGIGMDEETIRRVLKGESTAKADFFRKLGINNVSQRIHYAFGPEYGLSIQSSPGEYTEVTLTLPCQFFHKEESS